MAEEKKGFFRGLVEKITGKAPEESKPNGLESDANGAEPAQHSSLPDKAIAEETEQEKRPGFFERLKKDVAEMVSPAPGGDGPVSAETEQEKRPSFFERLKRGLSKTHENLIGKIDSLVLGKKEIDADTLEELEEILITADIGVTTAVELIRTLEQRLKRNELKDGETLKKALKEEILARLAWQAASLDTSSAYPFVILVIGVNGVGKTTTIGKLASRFAADGKKVVLAAADTFRAAAAEQLEIWGERAGADVIRHKEGADPSAVVFDACKAALARKCDILIVDTAGRLHTKVNLMEEMKKIRRILGRELPGAPHETLLILDAATGQNAISQARLFKESAAVTGIALTKLDGTAKGGIVVAVSNEFKIPVRFIGVGESVDDLREFDPALFVEALFQ
ncbi:MAG TPA: signal recognition particle-docking protein FtsY [Geobacteraceae bacterium]|nr:signal recognition particle-docking protein FtsY [Geobacteraceae bacterium]